MGSDFHSFANSFQAQPRLSLERIRAMLSRLGNPERRLKCIHIAGTNGKGSVAMFLDHILREAKYRVGRYTSPNLVRVNERIVVDGVHIPDERLAALFDRLQPITKEVETQCGESVSQFEIWTAAAFCYFAEEACDYVVLEVGMGGEFDATNAIETCAVSVITRIELDHTAYLGSTPAEIARTKCGIIKDNCLTRTVVSAPQLPEVAAVIEEEAKKHGNAVIFVDPPAPKRHYHMHESIFFPGYGDIRVGLCGIHQIENAYIALTVAKLLDVDIFSAQCGVTYARHPARMEVLRESPLMIYDGGHNPNGVAALMASLDRYLGEQKRTCIYACMEDKDFLPCLRMLAERPTRFVFTTVQNNPRAMSADALAARAKEAGIDGVSVPTLAEAIERATLIGDPTIICGSLYLYADLPAHLRNV